MKNKVTIDVDPRGLIDGIPYGSRLYDKRVKKVIVIDTETAPYYEDVEPYETTSDEYPMYNVVPDTEIEEYEKKNGNVGYKYMTDKKQKQIVFDIGYTIAAKYGGAIFIKRRHLVKEVFTDMQLMKHAHYFSKMPEYLMDLSDSNVRILPWLDIIQVMEKDINAFNITEVYAYNMRFDRRAIAETHRIITGRKFLMWQVYGLRTHCLWLMACETLLSRKSFIEVAIEEKWISEAGNIKTSAEMCYRYITQSYEFEEAHTALDDAIIETEIMSRCYATRQKMTLGVPKGIQPWAIVRDRAKELGLL